MEDGPPIFPPGFTCPAVLWIQLAQLHFRVQDSHLLRLAFPRHSARFLQCFLAVLTPGVFLLLVWPPPLSLATTCGISVDFFSSPYLDVSVQAVPLVYLLIQYTMTGHNPSRIAPFGNPRIKACFRLTVAYRRLLRPSSAPGAKAFPLRSL